MQKDELQRRLMPKLGSVQYLRALAAISVALYHALNQVKFQLGTTIPYQFLLSSGVDLFFVISGFIIWTTNWVQPVSVRRFAWNRLTRVLPLYWIFTIVAALVAPFSNYLVKGFSLHGLIYSLAFIPYKSWNGWPILAVGWTLNYEMFFYAVFGILLFLRDSKHLSLLITLVLGSLVIIGLNINSSNALVNAYTNPLLAEFVLGVLLGNLATAGPLPRTQIFGLLCAVFGLVALLMVPDFDENTFRFLRIIFWGVPNALIFLGVVSLEKGGLQFDNRFLILLGDASYSIYLTHGFPIMATTKLLKQSWWPQNALGFSVFALISLALIAAAGVIVHIYIEKPLLVLMKNSSIFSRLSKSAP